jgi:predicted MFS family arabinose efflux permease
LVKPTADFLFCIPISPLPKSSSTRVFYILVLSQFCGTSLWFAGNAILPQLQSLYGWQANAIGYLTSSVQLGFIAGTLTIGLTGITDRFSPSKIFLASSVFGAVCNLISLVEISSFNLVITSRFLTGVALAGIYPVGMKIAADWREQGLGHWLGALVGALVLGTSFPQALKLFPELVNVNALIITVSMIALVGGIMVWLFIPDGPFRKTAHRFSFASVRQVFQHREFRSAALGYFGHMWELYAFWAFVPWILLTYNKQLGTDLPVELGSFITIAAGALGCWLGGLFSHRLGSRNIATAALICSGVCCLLSPLIFQLSPLLLFCFLIFWGFMVVADSPQFSALVAQHAPQQFRGSAITMTTCIGFAITIVSIQLLNFLQQEIAPSFLLIWLLPGPVLGVIVLIRKEN